MKTPRKRGVFLRFTAVCVRVREFSLKNYKFFGKGIKKQFTKKINTNIIY